MPTSLEYIRLGTLMGANIHCRRRHNQALKEERYEDRLTTYLVWLELES